MEGKYKCPNVTITNVAHSRTNQVQGITSKQEDTWNAPSWPKQEGVTMNSIYTLEIP